FCRGDGGVDVLGVALRECADQLAGGGVRSLEGLSALRLDPLAANEVPEHLSHDRCVLSIDCMAGGHVAGPRLICGEVYQSHFANRHKNAVPLVGTALAPRRGFEPRTYRLTA